MPGVARNPFVTFSGVLDVKLLDTAERSFRLLCEGPSPLAVDGTAIGHDLPSRAIPLTELRGLLLHPSVGHDARDAAWRTLIANARRCHGAWIVGCIGVARPGLRRLTFGLSQGPWAADADDIAAEIVLGFTQALQHIDTGRPRIMLRLCRAAREACLRARRATAGAVPVCVEESDAVPVTWRGGHPDLLLAEAVSLGVITPFEAQLIGTTRLEGVRLTELASHLNVEYEALQKRRRRAEARLVAAIRDGRLPSKISN